MAAGAILKNLKIAIFWQRFDRSPQYWYVDAIRHSRRVTQIKNCNFKNPRRRGPPFWKIEKSPYLGHGFSDFDEIWHGDAVRSSRPFKPLQIYILKIHIAAAPSLKIEKSRNLGNGLTDRHNIWHDDATEPNQQLKFQTFKNEDGGRPPSRKFENDSINVHY